jgi:NADP-dependent 3-hydroxy acid dehydrogenase YdfG
VIELRDKVAIVTGAGSGIGRAIALSMAAQGSLLGLVGSNKQALEAVAVLAKKTSTRAEIYALDLNNDDDIRDLSEKVRLDFGKVDILVHSAGFFAMGTVKDASAFDLDRMFCTNVRAPFVLTQSLLEMLVQSKGQIVFINSTAGLNAQAGVAQYAATKHGLRALANSLRAEVNRHGVRVLTVYPGRTATPMQERIFRMEGRDYDPSRLLQPEDVASVVLNALRLPFTAEVTDITIRPFLKP